MSFGEPPTDSSDPLPIMQRLIDTVDLFETIRIAKADIMVIMRHDPKIKGGKMILGTMGLPVFQGANAKFGVFLLEAYHGAVPDFILTLDAEWWQGANEFEREALVFHELMHCMQALDREGEPRFTEEGMPVWAIRAHDIEAFDEETRRYGAWKGDIASFRAALRENSMRDAPPA